jgi:GTP-binding protein HflX
VDHRVLEEHLEELARLTHTAGGEVTSVLRQRIKTPSPRLFIGEGKAQELRDLVRSSGSSLQPRERTWRIFWACG